jgi:1,4-dihydroxy-2-naphthoate polyprenyltransferase
MNRWIEAARPQTLIAGIAPVVLGTTYAATLKPVSLMLSLLILVDALLIQIVTNLANDVLDFERGADTAERCGPRRVTQAGLVTRDEMWVAIRLLLLVAGSLGLYLVSQGGLVIFLIGISALFLSIGYTGGPFPLAYRGYGDLFTFFYFGPIALGGTAYLLLGVAPPPGAYILGCSCGLLATAFLIVNNVRDFQGDEIAQKHTLVVRLGVPFGKRLYSAVLFLALLLPMCGSYFGLLEDQFLLVGLLVPGGFFLTKKMKEAVSGVDYNTQLARTGIFYWLFLFLGIWGCLGSCF